MTKFCLAFCGMSSLCCDRRLLSARSPSLSAVRRRHISLRMKYDYHLCVRQTGISIFFPVVRLCSCLFARWSHTFRHTQFAFRRYQLLCGKPNLHKIHGETITFCLWINAGAGDRQKLVRGVKRRADSRPLHGRVAGDVVAGIFREQMKQ